MDVILVNIIANMEASAHASHIALAATVIALLVFFIFVSCFCCGDGKIAIFQLNFDISF